MSASTATTMASLKTVSKVFDTTEQQKKIADYLDVSGYIEAITYLEKQIAESKIYEEQAQLYKEKSAFNTENMVGFEERASNHKEKKDAFEKLAFNLGTRLTPLSPEHAIIAFKLIQYVGYYSNETQAEMDVQNPMYAQAQSAVAKIYAEFLKKAKPEKKLNICEEIFRATFNAQKDSGGQKDLKTQRLEYYAALNNMLCTVDPGLKNNMPKQDEFANSTDSDSISAQLARIYLGLIKQIRLHANPDASADKGVSEKKMLEDIQELVKNIVATTRKKARDDGKTLLLNLLSSYISPNPSPSPAKQFLSDFNPKAGTTLSHLILELPIFLIKTLWKLRNAKTVASSSVSMAEQSNSGTPIVTAFTASTSTTATAKSTNANSAATVPTSTANPCCIIS